MSKLMQYRYRVLIIFVLILVLGAASYGFAAENTVPDGQAGEGSGVISGYVVSNVKYTLNSSNPNLFDMVQFDLSDSATDVYAGIGASGVIEWVACTPGAGSYDFDCDLSGISTTVFESDELAVAAAN